MERKRWVSPIAVLCLLFLGNPFATKTGAMAGHVDELWQTFQDPPRNYSLMPYWFWNGRITPEETRRQIEEMVRQGVHQAVLFPWEGMEVRYLSEEYFRQIGVALDAARELGFTLNLADEFTWPSGHAWDPGSDNPELSRVLQAHPEFRMQRLEVEERDIEMSGLFKMIYTYRPEAISAFRLDADNNLEEASLMTFPPSESFEWYVPKGERWRVFTYRLVPAVGAHNTRVDLLNPKAVRVYLDLVYEEYRRRFPQHLGTTFQLALADHEGSYGAPIAWTPALWEEFQRFAGYDLRPLLPFLHNRTKDPERGRKVRRDYLEVISRLHVQSFTGQIAEWCGKYKLGYAASTYEEQLYIQVERVGDQFRWWRSGTHVEIDALLERFRWPVDFKEAGSVAHLEGKPLVIENQGLQGHGSFFSLEKARQGTNMCLLWGGNLLVPYFDYDANKIQYPPQWFRSQPFWPYFRIYADYVRRAQFMNGQGSHVAPIALYYPLETAFAESETLLSPKPHRYLLWNNFMDEVQNVYTALQLELFHGGWDYHVLDREFLKRAEISGSSLKIRDEEFSVLVLPPMVAMEEESVRRIGAFLDAGGKVLSIGELPAALQGEKRIARFPLRKHPPFMDQLNYTKALETPPPLKEDLQPLLQKLQAIHPPEVRIAGDTTAGLHWSHRRSDDVDMYWVVNDSDRERSAVWTFPGKGRFERWDAESGKRTPWCNAGLLGMNPWEAFYIVRSNGPAHTCPENPAAEEVLLQLPMSGWEFTPEATNLEVPYVRNERTGDLVWLSPERNGLRAWWLIGPFPNEDHQGFYKAYPPETEFLPEKRYNPGEGIVGWKYYESPEYTILMRDALARGRQQGIYYACTGVYSPETRTGRLHVASVDSVKVWWNGKETFSAHRHPKWMLLRDAWADRMEVSLKKGWNRLLLKIEAGMSFPTGFYARLADEKGNTLPGILCGKEELPSAEAAPNTDSYVAEAPLGSAVQEPFRFDFPKIPERPVLFPAGPAVIDLQSWTLGNLAYYSGRAEYEIEFQLASVPAGRSMWLDLGKVGVAAEVWVNQKSAGTRVWSPFRYEITSLVVKGKNRLKIRVANSDAGRQCQGGTIYTRGSWGLNYRTERDRLSTLSPNGLEGPVRLLIR